MSDLKLTEIQIVILKLFKLLEGENSVSELVREIIVGINGLMRAGCIDREEHAAFEEFDFHLTKVGNLELAKQENLIMTNLFCIALCGPICENDVEFGFFSEDWVQSAIDEGLLEKTEVTDMIASCDTIEYRVTRKFWQLVKDKLKPNSNSQLSLFFAVKLAKKEKQDE